MPHTWALNSIAAVCYDIQQHNLLQQLSTSELHFLAQAEKNCRVSQARDAVQANAWCALILRVGVATYTNKTVIYIVLGFDVARVPFQECRLLIARHARVEKL
jgi:hypothetical protein